MQISLRRRSASFLLLAFPSPCLVASECPAPPGDGCTWNRGRISSVLMNNDISPVGIAISEAIALATSLVSSSVE